MKSGWETPVEIDLPENDKEVQETLGDWLEKGVAAIKDGCQEAFSQAKERYLEAREQKPEERDSEYYKAEMDRYLELVKKYPDSKDLYRVGYLDAVEHYREELTKEQQEAQVKGLIGKTSFDYVDEMIEAKLDGNLSRYVNVFHEFEHYYHYTPNGWIERARGMDFWDTIVKMDNKLSQLYLKGY